MGAGAITDLVYGRNNPSGKLAVSCYVKNTGEREGAEVVQCYVQTLCADIVRLAKELIRFRKVFLKAGEETKVQFFISTQELMYYDEQMHLTCKGTPFRILAGNSSSCLKEAGVFQF